MTSKKLVNLFAGWLALSTPLALAGNDSGNGGHSVVCAKGADLTSIDFFDLWYAKKEIQMGLLSSDLDAKELGRATVVRLFQIDKTYFQPLLVSYASVSRAQVRIGDDLELVPPKAYLGNLVPSVDSGCRIAPLAVYGDNGVLLTDGKLWDFLVSKKNPVPANLHVAAFYVHEAIGDMLRKRALASLASGERLTEEARLRIARDTVSLTALAFAKLSDRSLTRRLKRYWTTGELFEKPKLDRFEISHRVQGGVHVETAPAFAEAKKLCEQWLEAEKTRLALVTEFLLGECGTASVDSEPGSALGYRGWRGSAVAKITLVPSRPVAKFSEVITSELFPPRGTDPIPRTISSWRARADSWKQDVQKRLGNRVFLINEGGEIQNQHVQREWRWRMHFAGDWRSGYTGITYPKNDAFAGFAKRWDDVRQLGELAWAKAEVYVFVDAPEIRTETDRVASVRYGFHSPEHESVEREAGRLALLSHDSACGEWLDARYKAGALYATCRPTLPEYRVEASESTAWFSSTGTAYFAEE